MSDAPLSREMALRIGLAARALPDTPPARLLRVLEDAVGLPPTEAALAGLRVKSLKAAAGGMLAEVPKKDLEAALRFLRGEDGTDAEPLPAVEHDDGAAGTVKVACASNTGEALDGHFGSCARFLIYRVSADAVRLVAIRGAEASGSESDKNEARAELIADCHVLYVVSIGGPAAAKVVKRGIHPIKFPGGGNARTVAAELGRILGNAPPPWLAKAMGLAPEARSPLRRSQET